MLERVAAIAAAIALTGCVLDVGSFARTEPLEERVVFGDGGPKIAMLEISGMISSGERSSSPLGIPRPSLVARSQEVLNIASEDDDVIALLVRVNSPGGTVSASETLYHEILRWKADTGKPVIAWFEGIAASGGYYVAMAADEVIAHPTAITGSIGVVMSGVNVSGLMERFGVEDQSFTSGDFKDSGSPFREMRPEERAHFQAMVDDLHARFQEVVTEGRPELEPAVVAKLADGRVYTARQAMELGLIDRIAHLDEAVEAIEKRVGVRESRVIAYVRPGEFRENLYTRAPVQVVDIDLLPFETRPLEPGFYYLWPPAGRSR